jgi:hypothetical protein
MQFLSDEQDYELARRVVERTLEVWGVPKEDELYGSFFSAVGECCQNCVRHGSQRWDGVGDKVRDPSAVWSLMLYREGSAFVAVLHDEGPGFQIGRVKACYHSAGITHKGVALMLNLADVEVDCTEGCTVTIRVSPGGAAR